MAISSGRLTTTHIVFDLRSLICGFSESYTIVHCTTSQLANVFSNAFWALWIISPISNLWLQFERGDVSALLPQRFGG